MNTLYKEVEITKQAVHKHFRRVCRFEQQVKFLIFEVEKLREEHPNCGLEKVYYTLQPSFIGRDRFIELFMSLGFRVRNKKNYRRTTYSSSFYYPNLIKGLEISSPNILWQSDITYIEVNNIFYYAVFIIDVYTKEIVGYRVSDHMRATANLKALKTAINQFGVPEIHHSDRGSQYIYKPYTELLKTHATKISMSLIAQENAYAERINKTIKEEYLEGWSISNFMQLKKYVRKAVEHYNTKRIHNNIGRKTPFEFRKKVLSLTIEDRPKIIIYTEVDNKVKDGANDHHFNQDLSSDHFRSKLEVNIN